MKVYDCVIAGGSYGGLSAALSLGRSLRSTVVIDEGLPCNRFTPETHNFLTHDGANPGEVGALGRKQLEETYETVSFVQGRVASVTKESTEGSQEFVVTTSSGEVFRSKRLVIATGLRDLIPDMPGVSECWGVSVIHCPYCHGYEYRGEATGILLSNVHIALHLAMMVRNLTPHVSIFLNGQPSPFSDDQLEQLKKNRIPIVETAIDGLDHDDGHLTCVRLVGGETIDLKVMYAGFPTELNGKDFIDSLGCQLNETGNIVVNPMQKTTVDGVFAVGDATTPIRSVSNAVNGGSMAGAVVNMELCAEDFTARM